jgi:hypothetical protein
MLEKYLVPFPKFEGSNNILSHQEGKTPYSRCSLELTKPKFFMQKTKNYGLLTLPPPATDLVTFFSSSSSSRVHKEIGILFMFHHWPSLLPEISGRILGAASTVEI